MIIRQIIEYYVDDDQLPTIASCIADDIEEGYVEDLESAILDEAYELEQIDSYWGDEYDEFADKLEKLVNEELARRDQAV